MIIFRILLIAALATFASACSSSSPKTSQIPTGQPRHDHKALFTAVDSLCRTVNGRVGIAMRNLSTGDSFAYNGMDSFAMFSTYKLPLALYILHLEEEGTITRVQLLTIEKNAFKNYRSGRFIETHPPATTALPVDTAIWYAMAYSDNITTDHLFKLAGGPSAVNDFVRRKGIYHMHIRNTVLEMGKDGLYKSNWCTPVAMTRLLQLFDKDSIVDATHREYLLHYMELAPSGANRMPKLLPAGTKVAHKTGTGGTQAGVTDGVNDIGIIVLPNRQRVALAVYINDLHGSVAEGEAVIASVAKLIYEHNL